MALAFDCQLVLAVVELDWVVALVVRPVVAEVEQQLVAPAETAAGADSSQRLSRKVTFQNFNNLWSVSFYLG